MRRVAIIALLFSGYAGYYFARANLSATTPLLIAYLHARGTSVALATVQIGAIASVGTLAYAFGKFSLTWIGDVAGGKRSFLFGILGAGTCTALFAAGGAFPAFMAAWIGNRFTQAVGWAAMVKVVSNWFSYREYGSVMAILSMSFLVGDAVTRGGIGALIGAGFGWRTIFLIVAGALCVLFLANAAFLRESASDAGERPANVRALVVPLLRSRAFLIVCALSFGTTLLREALGTWTPAYFTSALGFSAARAASLSALSPVAGIFSVLGAGWLSDRLGAGGRARVAFVGLGLAAAALVGIALLPKGAAIPAVALIAAVGFFNSGPYSFLAGAMALDFGGSAAASSSSGIIDGVGYIGGALAGVGVARLELAFGWSGAFATLAAVAAATSACAALLINVESNPRAVVRRERS